MIPRAIEDDPEHILIREGGETTGNVIIAFEEHDINRMRAGYVCMVCFEDLDTAFPDECPVCHFRMAEKQAEKFAREFQGARKVGPSTSLDEEREIMQYLRAKEARDSGRLWTPNIVVPRSL